MRTGSLLHAFRMAGEVGAYLICLGLLVSGARAAEKASPMTDVQRQRGCIVARHVWPDVVAQLREIAKQPAGKLPYLEDGRASTWVRGDWVHAEGVNIFGCDGVRRAAGSTFDLLKSADLIGPFKETGIRQFYVLASIPVVNASGSNATVFIQYDGNEETSDGWAKEAVLLFSQVNGKWKLESSRVGDIYPFDNFGGLRTYFPPGPPPSH